MTANISVVNVTRDERYEKRLHGCLAAFTKVRRYRKRSMYLAEAIGRGFRKHVIFVDREDVDVIEYAPTEASSYPIDGESVVVMSCIWVKKPEQCFEVHLVWMPVSEDTAEPEMDWREMLKGVDYCMGHSLYRAENWGLEKPLEFC